MSHLVTEHGPTCGCRALGPADRDFQYAESSRMFQGATTRTSPRIIEPSVYVIQFRDVVKIGFSSNVRHRLYDLPYERILLVYPASQWDEGQLHKRFAEHQIEAGGAREWFFLVPEIREWVASMQGEWSGVVEGVHPKFCSSLDCILIPVRRGFCRKHYDQRRSQFK